MEKRIIIYDIEDRTCYGKFIDEGNDTLFEIIEEANKWILGELDFVRNRVDVYYKKYESCSLHVKDTIDAYNLIKNFA